MRELREVLEGLLTEDESVRLNVQALAPKIERGLRAAAEEMAEHGDLEWKAHTDYRAVLDRCVTAGVAAMVEKP